MIAALLALPVAAAATEASLVAWVEQACDAVSVDVHWLGVDEDLDGALRWEGNPCRARPQLRLWVDDRPRTVRPHLTVWVRVPVASAPASPGQAISWEEGVAPVESVRGVPLRSEGLQARVSLDAGDPITDAVVLLPPDARRGAPVTLTVTAGSLTVTAPGELLEDGTLGQSVRVVNLATHTTQRGHLVRPDTVDLP